MNSEQYRRCGIDLCGYCFPVKNPDKIRCEYLPATQQAKIPEELDKGRECRHKFIKIKVSKIA